MTWQLAFGLWTLAASWVWLIIVRPEDRSLRGAAVTFVLGPFVLVVMLVLDVMTVCEAVKRRIAP